VDSVEEIIVIFPDIDRPYALLASSAGSIQVFEVPEQNMRQSIMEGLMDYVGMSLGNKVTFEMARAEMAQRLIPVEVSERELRGIMLQAMFRFLMKRDVESV